MKTISHVLAVLSAVTVSLAPLSARADRIVYQGAYYTPVAYYTDDGWDARHRHYSHEHDRFRYYSPDRVTIVQTPPPVVYGAPPVYYDAPAPGAQVVQTRCGYGPDSVLATVAGGALGGVLGHQIGHGGGRVAATIGGALLGGLLGQRVAYPDEYCTQEVISSVPVGTPVTWQSAGGAYTVVPTRDIQENGRYCREYQATATVGGQPRQTYGTACMQPDGTWEIMN